MEIRWFKDTKCIFLYKNDCVLEGKGTEHRVSVDIQQLRRGDVSLILREVRDTDEGVYTCQVIHGEEMKEVRLRLFYERTEKTRKGPQVAISSFVRDTTTMERAEMNNSVRTMSECGSENTGWDPPPVRRYYSEPAQISRRDGMDFFPGFLSMGGESPGPAPPVSPAVSELRLVLLGGSAAGKRAAGNTILGTHTHTHTHPQRPSTVRADMGRWLGDG
ncbi:uncharacterized protein LOC134079063 [Sardina pilchardus]|uniref:uncharacterized protein LOC134079063 n=1 Tax=Sardina pilchardus TaxID=27697 RepID=UPI002E14A512